MATSILNPEKIIGIDISDGMLELGRKKIEELGLGNIIELLNGDSETIKFYDNTFDAVTVAFGVRNFENLEKGLVKYKRVLKPGGKLVVLEFSKPKAAGCKAAVQCVHESCGACNRQIVFRKTAMHINISTNQLKNFPKAKTLHYLG